MVAGMEAGEFASRIPIMFPSLIYLMLFIYGTWFGIEGLVAAGAGQKTNPHAAQIKKACEFLISKQREDGGWGESFMVHFFLNRPYN